MHLNRPRRLRTGLHSWSRREQFKDEQYNVFHFLDEGASMGFTEVEILTGVAGKPSPHLGVPENDHLMRVADHAARRGVRIHSFSTYNDFAFTKDDQWRSENIQYILEWIERAANCGVPNLRLLTGYHTEGQSAEREEQLVIEGFRACVAKAEAFRVNLAIENHSSVFLYADGILRLVDLLGSANVTTCPDPTNGFDVGKTSGERDLQPLYRNLEHLAPKATCAHLKLFGIEEDTLVGYDLQRIIRILIDAGYEGPVMFETVHTADGNDFLIQAKRIVDQAIDRAYGHA